MFLRMFLRMLMLNYSSEDLPVVSLTHFYQYILFLGL